MESPIVKADSLAEQVYRYLRHEILTAGFAPGSKLVESQLAKDFQISRSPLREAIRRLEQEGLLVTAHGVTHLFEPTQQDFEDLYELRMALEPLAAGLAVRHMADEDFVQMRTLLERTELYLEADQVDAFVESNAAFHDMIVQASNNQRLIRAMAEVSSLARYYRYICFKLYRRQVDSAEQHWRVYRALVARDEELARDEMYNHLAADLAYIHSTAYLMTVR
ncbi:GntR family transcriptional regulator [Alicyclobacillus sp. ALC3]|uniref:GntR family transcriptional regulator n=1 Tax=Alicyclobacillus sp. ALC3 TaxID=2796143 RepID=UPI0023788655|nr:GntR family transcriptional regulator [Alicyclobacillus sp. ALC3]WDL95678.1 GntR family transcriptional regulator [Alicyclobacillus sp. ALC3]